MRTLVVVSILLCAAFAAPAEDQAEAPEAAEEAPQEELAAAAVGMRPQEDADGAASASYVKEKKKMVKDEQALQDSASVQMNARFNFCPEGWFSFGTRCFKFINSPMSWYSAEEHCNNMGGHLASVRNPRENSFLQHITQTAGQSIAWLGGFNLQGRWMWIDREGLYYNNWHSSSSTSSNPCMFLRSTNGWGNSACGTSYRFICSKDPFSC